MPKTTELFSQQQTEHLIDAIDKLTFTINDAKKRQNYNYSEILINIILSLKEIGNKYTKDGCLNQICEELKNLNKNIIVATLLISAPQNPEQILQQYNNIIEQYLK